MNILCEVTYEIDGTKITLTIEQAKQLLAELKKLFSEPVIIPTYPEYDPNGVHVKGNM